MENLVWQLKSPCVMDIKLGTRLYGDDATAEKRRKMVQKAKQCTSAELGFRLTGFKCTTHALENITVEGKEVRNLNTREGFKNYVLRFLACGGPARVRSLAAIYSKRVGEMVGFFETQKMAAFFGSSLLLCFDAHKEDCDNLRTDMRMIDFAHARLQCCNIQRDEGYLHGLRNLQSIFEEIQA
eukprot:GHVO01011480.1.p1 GENE.GHVO01011480.1~~GHVO01011480.1.p1  ORF type:complete len:183 (+),score=27.70 GHVO01011480.1:3-551(+)